MYQYHQNNERKRILIFLDIDGTLITPAQKTNSNSLPRLIRELGKQGILFGLNSNRSIEDLQPLYRKFFLNGPIIAENGVYFIPAPKKKKHFLIPRPPKT